MSSNPNISTPPLRRLGSDALAYGLAAAFAAVLSAGLWLLWQTDSEWSRVEDRMKAWTQTTEIPERNYATELSRERVELVKKYHRIAYGTVTVLLLIFAASAVQLWQQHRQARSDALALETEQKARQDAEQEYHSLFDNAIEGIFQTTPDGRIITANRALSRMYGYESPQQLMELVTDVAAQLYVEPGQRQALLDALRVSG